MKQKISKVDIVCAQINRACELHLAGDFVGSLTLGGSAESLGSGLVLSRKAKDKSQNTWSEIWLEKFIRFWNEKKGMQSPSKDVIYRELRWARNLIKHHDKDCSEIIEINLELESFLVITRAIENYRSLEGIITKQMDEFNEGSRNYG